MDTNNTQLETFLDAVHQRLMGEWWNARDLLFALPPELWPRDNPTGLGRWLSAHSGQRAGGLLLEKRERMNWSAQYRVVALEDA